MSLSPTSASGAALLITKLNSSELNALIPVEAATLMLLSVFATEPCAHGIRRGARITLRSWGMPVKSLITEDDCFGKVVSIDVSAPLSMTPYAG